MTQTKQIYSTDETDVDEILDELEAEDDEAAPSTERQIEQKYDEGQARIIIQRNDFLVPNLLDMFEKKEVLDMSPPYQRRTRWNGSCPICEIGIPENCGIV